MAAPPRITDKGRELAIDALTSAVIAGPATVILMDLAHSFTAVVDWLDSVDGDEIVATNYARQLATFDPTAVLGDGRVVRTILPTVFGLVGGAVNATVSGCYLFGDSGDPATSPLLACVEFASPLATDGTTMRITWPLETLTFDVPIR